MLRVEGLAVAIHGTPILRGLSFALSAGESLGVVGESGSGKSMMALAIMGLLPPMMEAAGQIHFQGQDLLMLGDDAMTGLRGKRIAMIFQEPMSALNPTHRIGDQISEGMILHETMAPDAARREALRLLERVGIDRASERLDAYPHELSGGQRQRVMIAMALACRPALLIADEPSSALDVTVQAEILALLRQLAREEGMAMLFISHDLDVIARIAARMLVVYGGMVMESGATAQVLAAPRHPYTRGLLGALPSRRRKGERLAPIAGSVPPPHRLAPGCPFFGRCPRGDAQCRDHRPPMISGATDAACFHLEGA